MLNTEGEARGFQHQSRDLVTIDALKKCLLAIFAKIHTNICKNLTQIDSQRVGEICINISLPGWSMLQQD